MLKAGLLITYKQCFKCGNDWCLNLIDDPIDPEDNLCDHCRSRAERDRCPACANETRDVKKNFLYIMVFIFLSMIPTYIFLYLLSSAHMVIGKY